jgi:hypothetical protein
VKFALNRWCFILLVPAYGSGQTFTATEALRATPSGSFLSLPNKTFVTGPRLQWPLPFNAEQHTFMFGPKWKLFDRNRFSVNVWALGGVAKRFALMDPFVLPTNAKPPLVSEPFQPPHFMGPNGLAVSVGGSVGLKITDHLKYDVVTPEYLTVRGRGPTHDLRVSSGFRLNFGPR